MEIFARGRVIAAPQSTLLRSHVPSQLCRALSAMSGVLIFTVGCHHQAQVAYQPPPPPVRLPSYSASAHRTDPVLAVPQPAATPGYDDTSVKPILVETGIASWYGPNYHHHAAADGTIFDQNELTAAHRTLPLGTTVRVTNVATGQQVLVRITDRGPFDPNRILDLSKGAADAIGGVRLGLHQGEDRSVPARKPRPRRQVGGADRGLQNAAGCSRSKGRTYCALSRIEGR